MSLGKVPCVPPPPMRLLSRGLDWGVSPMDSRLLHWQPFMIWKGTLCVPGGSALHNPAPHETTFTGPCCPDPEEDISGSHLHHGVRLATSHPSFINGGNFGSPSSSFYGSSSVPLFWLPHGGLHYPPLILLVIIGGLHPPPLILLVIVVGLPSPPLLLGL